MASRTSEMPGPAACAAPTSVARRAMTAAMVERALVGTAFSFPIG
jgi:hypothetical protein